MKNIEKQLLTPPQNNELNSENFTEKILKLKNKNPKKTIKIETVTEFSKLNEEDVLSKNATYYVYNIDNETDSFLDGKGIDGIIGNNQELRNKLINREIDNFETDNFLVKFNSFRKK